MKNLPEDRDCEGTKASPDITKNAGIFALRDVCALDPACLELVFDMEEKHNKDLV